MTSTSAPPQGCGPITGPITDTATYTYSDLDASFSPPELCLQPTFAVLPDNYNTAFSWLDTFTLNGQPTTSVRWMRLYRGREPTCFPSNYPKACEYQGTTQQQKNYIYSPGTCPGGYAPATNFVGGSATEVTTALCCPSGFALSTVTNIPQTFWGDRASCTSLATSIVVSNLPTTFPPDVLTYYAPTVVVAWQSSDLARWKKGQPTSTSTGSLPESTAKPGSGLSTGAKAGIGVGCAVVAIVAIAILLLFRRNRARNRAENRHRELVDDSILAPREDKKLPVKDKGPQVELADATALQEMTGYERRHEADHMHTRAELP